MEDKKLFLIDGHAMVYRAHYAFINRPLLNSKGQNTPAISGFVRSLWEIIKNQKPSHIAVSFDLRGPTFRHIEYPLYKANRDKQPEDITFAIPKIREIIEAFNIPIITKEGFEADDVIGTLAKKAEKEGFDVYMVTPDKDYAQLVSDKVFMYKPARMGNGIDILGAKEVKEKWGIARVDQVIDVLGLQGDSVDNIPGVPGIGPKTATKLLALYDSMEGILANTDKLKGKQKENLENFAEQGLLSKHLATIVTDVDVEFNADVFKIEPINKEKAAELFEALEFRTLANQILGVAKKPTYEQGSLFGAPMSMAPSSKEETVVTATKNTNISTVAHDYQLVDTEDLREKLIDRLKFEAFISFDTETTGLDPHEASLVGMSFSTKEHQGYYVPVPADYDDAKEIVDNFKEILENPDIKKYGQNIKYDMNIMRWYDVEIRGKIFDTMLAHYLSEPDMRHKLDHLSENYLNYKMVPIEDLIGKRGKNQLSMRDVPLEKVSEYASEDSDICLQLVPVMEAQLKEKELLNIYDTIEEPLITVLSTMEYEGIRVNGDFLKAYSVDLSREILEKEQQIYKKAGVTFNIASPTQVGQVLFERLEIPYRWKKTKSGKYSTDVTKLTELAEKNEIVNDILEFRKYAKLKSTYVDALPRQINPKSGRIHTSFNQARAATGRLSSENPNLQNIPIRNEAGRKIREAFIPRDENYTLLAADYSQVELRLIAEMSDDKNMLDAFVKGQDFHRATAAKVYDVPYDEVTDEQRRNAKTVNFSITYGAGSQNLRRQLGITTQEAKALMDSYFEQFSGLKKFMDKTVAFARENGYVQTYLGRKRYLRDINSQNGMARSNAERMAINTPVQGTAADMIKIAMINIHELLKNYKTKMLLQVHDELVFDLHLEEKEVLLPKIDELMRNAIPSLKVPILVEMDTGDNWLQAH